MRKLDSKQAKEYLENIFCYYEGFSIYRFCKDLIQSLEESEKRISDLENKIEILDCDRVFLDKEDSREEM